MVQEVEICVLKSLHPCFPHLLFFFFLVSLVVQIKLGTMDQDEAQTEWVLRPYMNTSKKKKILGD